MGCCISLQSPVSWPEDEDWMWSEEEPNYGRRSVGRDEAETATTTGRIEEENLLDRKKGGQNARPVASAEVKIKITKKELRELLRQAELQRVPIHRLLAQLLMSKGDDLCQDHHGQWRPALKSIPEVSSE